MTSKASREAARMAAGSDERGDMREKPGCRCPACALRATANTSFIRAACVPRPRLLFPLGGADGRLPRLNLSAWRGGDHLDLVFLRLLGFPIAFLLAFCHVGLPWV